MPSVESFRLNQLPFSGDKYHLMMKKLFFTAVYAIYTVSLPALAQQAPLRLRLPEALEIAVKQQPDFNNAERNIAFARSLTRSSKAAYLPRITAESDIRYNVIIPTSVLPANAFNPSGDPKELIPIRFGTPWNNSMGLRMTQPLYDPVKISTMNGSLLGEKQAEVRQRRLKADRYEDLARAWYGLMLERARSEYKRKEIESNLANETLIRDLLKEGRALEIDHQEANIRTRSSKLDLEKSSYDILSLQANISYLMGYDTLVLIEPVETFENLMRDPTNELIGEFGMTTSNGVVRTDLEEEKILEQIDEIELARKKAEKLPVVNFEGYLGGNNFSYGFRPFQNWYGNSFLGLSLRWPIFSGGEKRHQIEQAQIRLEQQKNNVKRVKQQIDYDILKSENDLRHLKSLWEVQNERIKLEKERTGLIKTRLMENRATGKDLVDAETSVAREVDALCRIEHDYLLARLALQKASGSLFQLKQ